MSGELSFEKSLEKLEKIVDDLESGDITLDEALKKYEEGIKLSGACQDRLSKAEKKIEMLSKSATGQLKKEPFELEETEKPSSSPVKRRKVKDVQEDEDGDGDLLI
ncbi:MAG: exodeoxyribonuclease VII small subunit [Candidatus Omnitrophica bacterium]|nr:exodeoxyribonuclease VII small subunit [Candidatus Omnitrophota bacterium]